MNLVAEAAIGAAPHESIEPARAPEYVPGEPFVHMHIPKTAGTSMRRMFEDEFGADRVYLFNHETNKLIRSDHRQMVVPSRYLGVYHGVRKVADKLGLFGLASNYIDKKRAHKAIEVGHDLGSSADLDFMVISGHLGGQAVQSESLDNYPVVTVVREPFERAMSFYAHWQRTKGGMFAPYFENRVTGETRFEDVTLGAEQQNFQSRWIAGLALARIGVVEHLGEFLDSINMPRAADKVLVANQDPTPKDRPQVDKGFMREFEAANAADYELYHRTLEAWS